MQICEIVVMSSVIPSNFVMLDFSNKERGKLIA